MVKNLLKMEQNSPEIEKMSENAKVHLDLCFTYPNGSPHDPESTEIGRFSDIFATFCYQKTHRKKVTKKRLFIDLGSISGSQSDPENHQNG